MSTTWSAFSSSLFLSSPFSFSLSVYSISCLDSSSSSSSFEVWLNYVDFFFLTIKSFVFSLLRLPTKSCGDMLKFCGFFCWPSDINFCDLKIGLLLLWFDNFGLALEVLFFLSIYSTVFKWCFNKLIWFSFLRYSSKAYFGISPVSSWWFDIVFIWFWSLRSSSYINWSALNCAILISSVW